MANGTDADETDVVGLMRLSDSEELANAITHGLAFLLSSAATLYVMTNHQFVDTRSKIGFAAYGCSLVFVFLFSTLSHIARDPVTLHRFRAWDQGTIYLLIVGTYTPGIVLCYEGLAELLLVAFIWGIACYGFYTKVIAKHRINAVTTLTYLLLGWLPAAFLYPYVSWRLFIWFLAGGICYTIGVAFLLYDRRVRYFHVVWHLFVILAAGIHFYAICSLVI